MKVLSNEYISDVSGFVASGISGGLKKSGKKDLGVIYSSEPAVCAATLTQNKSKAAPIYLTIENLQSDYIQAIVVNSGNANACTGAEGMDNAYIMADETAKNLDIDSKSVLVASTGVIGVQLNMDKIIPGIQKACEEVSEYGGKDMAQAIMTTDTFVKSVTVETSIGERQVKISGIAKGSGMIHPNMATMLSFIVTNAKISKEHLNKLFKDSVKDSYNMISVDGDTSTNDMAVILANGTADNPSLEENEDYSLAFKEALDYVNIELAKMMAKDGEGATKFIEVSVNNAFTKDDARIIARSVVSSNLVKAAMFGSDANWGRIMCAVGYADANFDISKIDISFTNKVGTEAVVKDGIPLDFSEENAKKILEDSHIKIVIDLKNGEEYARSWGCDLTYDYVKINGEYRS